RIYVLEEAQRTGAGTALLRACVKEARARGAETLWLTAWSENRKALSFYRRHGFLRVGTHPFRLGSLVFLDPVLARPVQAPNR
ncbi:MAG TPA: GNAT family N-acetyltransferase, partial [Longimicrobiales bacterium]